MTNEWKSNSTKPPHKGQEIPTRLTITFLIKGLSLNEWKALNSRRKEEVEGVTNIQQSMVRIGHWETLISSKIPTPLISIQWKIIALKSIKEISNNKFLVNKERPHPTKIPSKNPTFPLTYLIHTPLKKTRDKK